MCTGIQVEKIARVVLFKVVMSIGSSDGQALCMCEGDDVWAHTLASAISGADTGLLD